MLLIFNLLSSSSSSASPSSQFFRFFSIYIILFISIILFYSTKMCWEWKSVESVFRNWKISSVFLLHILTVGTLILLSLEIFWFERIFYSVRPRISEIRFSGEKIVIDNRQQIYTFRCTVYRRISDGFSRRKGKIRKRMRKKLTKIKTNKRNINLQIFRLLSNLRSQVLISVAINYRKTWQYKIYYVHFFCFQTLTTAPVTFINMYIFFFRRPAAR